MSAIQSYWTSVNLTIAASGTNSTSVAIPDYVEGSFQFPAAMTGTAVNVQVSNDNTNWTDVDDFASGATLTFSKTDDAVRRLSPETFAAKYLRFVSNGTEGAQRTITVLLKGNR